MLQLKYAEKNGMKYPHTLLLNSVENIRLDSEKEYIIKSLDTVLLRQGNKEAFVYSTVITGKELMESEFAVAPVIIQEYLYPKVDLRVTVVGGKVFAVKILKEGNGIAGDWRKEKENVDFIEIDLPEDINNKCIEVVKKLGLAFGGVDLILHNGIYYFIEVNPTGEWAWLVNKTGLRIDKAICDYLQGIE